MKRGYHFGLVFSSTNRFGMAMFFLRTGQTSESRRQAPTLLAVSTTSQALSIAEKKQTRNLCATDNSPERVTGAPEHLR